MFTAKVTLNDKSTTEVQAHAYSIDKAGALVFSRNDSGAVRVFAPGWWREFEQTSDDGVRGFPVRA